MLYLPRLFVYHCAAEKGSVQSETFKVMERRLLRAIINPAMIATWVLGLGSLGMALILATAGSPRAGCRPKWCWCLCCRRIHGMLARWVKDFAADRNRHSQKFYRIINEVPTILMIGIVILVVVKPF